MPDTDVAASFPRLLRAQIRHGLTTAHQYLAAAVYFEVDRLPRLARFSYLKADEHRAEALRMVRHLVDRGASVAIDGLDEVRPTFESPQAAITFLHAREQTIAEQANELTRTARATGDYIGEQFMQWFIKQQLHDVTGLATLTTVCDRAAGNLFDIEDFVARELLGNTTLNKG